MQNQQIRVLSNKVMLKTTETNSDEADSVIVDVDRKKTSLVL